MNKKDVALRIRQVMRKSGITQKGLADYLGISQPAVSLYLQGRLPPADVLLQIAQLGNTTVEWLLTGKDAREAGGEVKEAGSTYGSQVVLTKLWNQLPENLQRDLLLLMRHLTEQLRREY